MSLHSQAMFTSRGGRGDSADAIIASALSPLKRLCSRREEVDGVASRFQTGYVHGGRLGHEHFSGNREKAQSRAGATNGDKSSCGSGKLKKVLFVGG